MKSKIFKWYERHERAVNAVLDIVCDAVPGGGIIKGLVNFAQGVDLDQEEVNTNARIEQLETILAEIKTKNDLIEEIEHLEEFKGSTNSEELKKAIYNNKEVLNELNDAIPSVSASITKSLETLNSIEQGLNQYESILHGKYTLEDCLATGGQGTVYKGRNTIADTYVAIKLLPEEFSKNTHGVEMLKEEYKRLVNKLSHRYIIQYRDLDFSKKKQQWFIAMDYVDGYTLRKPIFERGKKGFTPFEVYEYLHPIAQALEHAHHNQVVHCDLKPENIMISKDNNIFLTDFGLAQEVQQSIVSSSQSTLDIGGTLPYMAPEQFKGRGVTKQSDIWALGVIMYEMLAGTHPFQGRSYEHYKDIICNESPAPLQDKRLWNILRQTLHKNEKERISSAETLVNYLVSNEEIEITTPEIFDKKNDTQKNITPTTTADSLYQKGLKYKAMKTEEADRLAFEALEKAADMSHLEALYELALFADAKGDPYTLVTRCTQATLEGHIKSTSLLGKAYYTGKGTTQDYNQAFKYSKIASDAGDPLGLYQTAEMLFEGKGVEKDTIKAIELFQKAIEKGSSQAMKKLGIIYKQGKEVNKDISKAIKLLENAAENGNIEALKELGVIYEEGKDIQQCHEKAKNYFEKAIKLSEKARLTTTPYLELLPEPVGLFTDPLNILDLATMYENGHGVEINYKKAFRLYQLADSFYQSTISQANAYNEDILLHIRNLQKELQLKMANQEYQNYIENAQKYKDGINVERDLNKAIEFYNEAYFKRKDPAIKTQIDILTDIARYEKTIMPIEKNSEDYIKKVLNEAEFYYRTSMRNHLENDLKETKRSLSYKCYKIAAEAGNQYGIIALASFMRDGFVVEQDIDQAISVYEQLAANNNKHALFCLGTLYKSNEYGIMDYNKAFRYFSQAQQLGNVYANLEIAEMYEKGLGISIDLLMASALYEKYNKTSAHKKNFEHQVYFIYDKIRNNQINSEKSLKEKIAYLHTEYTKDIELKRSQLRRKIKVIGLTTLGVVLIGVGLWGLKWYNANKDKVITSLKTIGYPSLAQLHANYWEIKDQQEHLRKMSILTGNKILTNIQLDYSTLTYKEQAKLLEDFIMSSEKCKSTYEKYILKYNIAKLHKTIAFAYHNNLDKLFLNSFNRPELMLLNTKLGGHGYVQCTQQKYQEICDRLQNYRKSEVIEPFKQIIKKKNIHLQESSKIVNVASSFKLSNIGHKEYYDYYSSIIEQTNNPALIIYMLKKAYENHSLIINGHVSEALKEIESVSKGIDSSLTKFKKTTFLTPKLALDGEWKIRKFAFSNDLNVLAFLYGDKEAKYTALQSIRESNQMRHSYFTQISLDITRGLVRTEIPYYQGSQYNTILKIQSDKDRKELTKALSLIRGDHNNYSSEYQRLIEPFHKSLKKYYNKYLINPLPFPQVDSEKMTFLFELLRSYNALNNEKLDFKQSIFTSGPLSHYIKSEMKEISVNRSQNDTHRNMLLSFDVISQQKRSWQHERLVRQKYLIMKEILEKYSLRFGVNKEDIKTHGKFLSSKFRYKISRDSTIDFYSNQLEKFYQANIESLLYSISGYNYIKMINTLQNANYITALETNKYISSYTLYQKLDPFRNKVYSYLHNSVRDPDFHKELIDLMLIPYKHVQDPKEKKAIYEDIKKVLNGFKKAEADKSTGNMLLKYIKSST